MTCTKNKRDYYHFGVNRAILERLETEGWGIISVSTDKINHGIFFIELEMSLVLWDVKKQILITHLQHVVKGI
jgi:hypothetical protein